MRSSAKDALHERGNFLRNDLAGLENSSVHLPVTRRQPRERAPRLARCASTRQAAAPAKNEHPREAEAQQAGRGRSASPEHGMRPRGTPLALSRYPAGAWAPITTVSS